jgi:hypothetical protein
VTSKKISAFTAVSAFADTDLINIVRDSTNYTVLWSAAATSLGVTGAITGTTGGTAVLYQPTSTSNIVRSLTNGSGVTAYLNATNGITLKHNFTFDSTGAAMTADATISSPVIRSIVAGGGASVVGSANTVTISIGGSSDVVFDSGKGVDFSAYSDGSVAGTTTSQTLLDYEEGTWTPVLSDGTNTATHSLQAGTYTKIGRMVHIRGRITTTSLTGTGTVAGNIQITGLPYTSSSDSESYSSITFGYAAGMNLTATEALNGRIYPGGVIIEIRIWNVTTGNAVMDAAEWSATGDGIFDATYYV